MAKKAQAELIVIVGVIFLAAVVIYYSLQGGIFTQSNVPQDVYRKQVAVHESFIGMARRGSENVLMVMETHGGYPTAELLGSGGYKVPPYAVFMDEGIPYWAMCENDVSPSRENITRWFEMSMENYIKAHISEITDTYRNASFDLSKLSVSASISSSPNKVDLTINLPTKVDGYALQGSIYPYRISLNTKLGEISDFARDFSRAQSSKRFLEVFTEASIYFSKNADDDNPKLPTAGVLTNCGEVIFRTPDQVSAYLKEIAEYVITQTLWWRDMPVDPAKPKVYAINKEIMGKEYRDLQISMHLPDGFAFETREPIIITNDEPVYTSPFWDAFKCMALYGMTYSVSYPVIIRVKDPLSGNSFNFAVMVFSKGNEDGTKNVPDMAPGRCEDIGLKNITQAELNCSANLTVVDDSGSPVPGAVAAFGKVVIGVSDIAGKIEGNIMCGNFSLSIYKNSDYDFYARNVSSFEINRTYVLHRVPEFDAHFRVVSVAGTEQTALKCLVENLTDLSYVDFSGSRKFTISNIDPGSIPESCMNSSVCRECKENEDINKCKVCASGCMGVFLEKVRVSYIPAGEYKLDATVLDIGEIKESGGFISSYGLKANATDIYLNIPLETSPFWFIGDNYKISDERKKELAEELKATCGMNTVSEKPYQNSLLSTNCTCGNLNIILQGYIGKCVSQSEVDGLFCKCPAGTPYPSGCGQPCSPGPCMSQVCPPNPPPLCYDCCASPDQVKVLLESKCNTKVTFACE